ncbi:MAG: hypothetical protein ACK4KT_05295 [Thermaurantimonas sp.]
MTINEHIINLLFSYDCVIIPGFGGFVARYFPAEIQEGTYMFRPPSKRVSFNARLKENDGLLAHYISQKEGISYHEAMQTIEISVRAWNRILESGNKISLDGIGKIYQDSEGNLQFTPSLEANFLTSAYGLGLFRSPAVSAESMIVQSIRQQAQVEGQVYEHRNAGYFISNLLSTVKVASVVLIVGSVFYLAVDNSNLFKKSQTDSFSYIGFSTFTDSTEFSEQSGNATPNDKVDLRNTEVASLDFEPQSSKVFFNSDGSADLLPSQRYEDNYPVVQTEATAPDDSDGRAQVQVSNPKGDIKISAGVFAVEDNALKRKQQIADLSMTPEIEPVGKFFRVIVRCNKNEVDQILLRIKESVASDAFVIK